MPDGATPTDAVGAMATVKQVQGIAYLAGVLVFGVESVDHRAKE